MQGRHGKEKDGPLCWSRKFMILGVGVWEFLDGITDSSLSLDSSLDMSLSKLQELVMDREACFSPWGRKKSDVTE